MKTSKILKSVEQVGDYLAVKTEGAQFQVYFLDENIIRLRGTFRAEFEPEESYALIKTAWPDQLDDFFKEERQRVEALKFDIKKIENGYEIISSGNYRLEINADPFYFKIFDKDGQLVHKDLPGRSFLQNDLGQSFHYSVMSDDSKYYGFGEKSGELNKLHRHMRNHNTDSLGWDATKSDPLYKMIPFYIKFDSSAQMATGIFYNTAYDSAFDMDCEHSNYWEHHTNFEADSDDLDIFFIGGPTIKDVVTHYTDLTGKSAMMPLASLGYMGSTMFYTELDKDSDQAILDFVDTCKENEIPVDGFFLSSGYTSIGNKRYVFNWNHTRFPDPQKFVNDLKARGVLLAPNIKPGMLLDHPLINDFIQNEAYIRTADQKAFQVDRYWGGDAHFVDFTSSKGRETWTKHMNEQLLSLGITSIWNDNNEYEINDTQAIAEADGLKRPIGALKPVMPTMMAKTAQEALAKHASNVRPYIVNRAGFAGIQRYAQTWAGDNGTTWANLKYNVPTILGMGLSGVANQGCDIGGFDGPAPSPELFVRWVQNGVFQPRFSIHSCNNDNTVTEPWMYPSYTKYIREAIQLRYRLVPYFYSLLHEASVTGAPIMRPLVYEFQSDPAVAEESFEFMLGSSLLVANVLDKGQTLKEVYLPKGSDWYDLRTYKYYEGGQTIKIPVDLASIPMFLRTGGIIVEAPGLMNLHNDIISSLKLTIEPSAQTEFSLYEDDGKTLNYKSGESLETLISVIPKGNDAEINFSRKGNFKSTLEKLTVNVLCPKIAPLAVKLNEHSLPQFLKAEKFAEAEEGWLYEGEKQQVSIKFKNPGVNDYSLSVESGVKDLISI